MSEGSATLSSENIRANGCYDSSMANQASGLCSLFTGNQIMLAHLPMRLKKSATKKNGKLGTTSIKKFEPLIGHELLASTLDALDVGLEIWDENDKLVLYNKKINRLQAGFHVPNNIGQTFESLARVNLAKHLIKIDTAGEQEWLTQRLSSRGKNSEPLLCELAEDHWVNLYETRTPEGFLVVAWVDVTELVRKSRILEAINHQLVYQSATDGLTGLANRRRLDEALAIEWRPDSGSPAPLGLLMIDIDHFKRYNDHYGHIAGDQCLRKVAGILNQCVRRTGELVARYGGEEFVMLLPGTNMEHACETAQKCLDLLYDEALPHATSLTSDRVTLSIGVACLLPDDNLDVARILNAADAAMYRAKSEGRARYTIAKTGDWEMQDMSPLSTDCSEVSSPLTLSPILP